MKVQQKNSRAKQTRLEARTRKMESARGGDGAAGHTADISAGRRNRASGSFEQQAGELGEQQREREAQLNQLREELEASQNQWQAQQAASCAEQTRLEARTGNCSRHRQTWSSRSSGCTARWPKRRALGRREPAGGRAPQRAPSWK